MRCHHWITLAQSVLTAALLRGECAARTWRVEANGTGDHTIIRAAVLAASPGDSILVGPGRYTFSAPFSPAPGSWVERTHVAVDKDNLTIRGTDRDAVIVGPTTPDFEGFGPKGFVTHMSVARLKVENLTIENVHDGLYLLGNVTVSDCRLRACDLGVSGGDGLTLLVDGSEFVQCREGVTVFDGRALEVRDSTFRACGEGVGFISCQDASVRRSFFEGCIGGTTHEESTGNVEACRFVNCENFGIGAIAFGTVAAIGNTVQGGATSVTAYSSSHVSGTGNLFSGATYASIYLVDKSTCSLRTNDIIPGGALAVRVSDYLSGSYVLDLSENYWGAEAAAEIAARIWDSNDDPSLHATVVFEPFAIQSVPTEVQSFGGLKARFGGQGH